MTVKTKRLAPRKRPRQSRSRATVDALLEAATCILVREGYARATTNRIAERAGVNVASLYQYFPNKDALLQELLRRHLLERHAAVRNLLAGADLRGPRATLRAIVEAGIAEHAVAPELHRVFTEEMPRFRPTREIENIEAELMEDFHKLIAGCTRGVRNLDVALWVAATAAHAVIHQAVLESSHRIPREALTEELTFLLQRYLQRPARATR